jgi:hypothetical protein
MSIDFDLIRALVKKAELEAPLEIKPAPLRISVGDPKSGTLSMSIQVPDNEGEEYRHWRILSEVGLIRVTTDGRPGFGRSDIKVEGLTADGEEFAELSRDDHAWKMVIARCEFANAKTIAFVISELKKEARDRLRIR